MPGWSPSTPGQVPDLDTEPLMCLGKVELAGIAGTAKTEDSTPARRVTAGLTKQ